MNAVTWFEIPAIDFDRATDFYSTVLDKPLRKENFNGIQNGIFPNDGNGVGGAVVLDENIKPSAETAIIYLNAGDKSSLEAAIARVEAAGGKVLLPCTSIGNPGHISLILDTEGNRVGLHAPSKPTS